MCQGDLILFHILVQPLFALKENVLDVYTEVAAFMGWINQTILSMGGMQACGITLEASHTEGWFLKDYFYNWMVTQVMISLSLT